ncbi:DUF423 domain-containing protein [Carboxylicivirga sp. A043]|uniref:DUF423 domain-containing protein n=1 Tax=Carboxylicivirga litoralis TaxID=2816963 RepID=UPI0021CB4EC5|nr:DUF423 domain-containing protein [Carboxylicivirga sp. A043]MCU4156997.1 DUF423 domain-containing protein [Carboxylicivirga sp. A043]
MKQVVLIIATIYGGLSVVFGALGAHALKKVLTAEQLQSFEVGVKYQMYHAIVLLVLGLQLSFDRRLQTMMGWSFILGTFLFSFSIYLLNMSSAFGGNLKILGPVTPFGGLLLIVGWCLLLIHVLKGFR